MILEVPGLFFDIIDRHPHKRCRAIRSPSCPRVNASRRAHLRPRSSSPKWPTVHRPKMFHNWLDAVQKACEKKLQKPKPTMTINKVDVFSQHLDLHQFAPSEITVKVEDNNILVVEGRREMKSDDGHYEFWEYRRKVTLPENVITEQLKCTMMENGQLQIEAPLKKAKEEDKPSGRTIPIEFATKQKSIEEQSPMAI